MNSREPSLEPLSDTTTLANAGSSFTSLSANTESSAVAIFSLSFQQTTMTSIARHLTPRCRPGPERSVLRFCRYGQMKPSRSPSSTACALPVSTFVRRSFTSWYGCST